MLEVVLIDSGLQWYEIVYIMKFVKSSIVLTVTNYCVFHVDLNRFELLAIAVRSVIVNTQSQFVEQ